MENTENMKSLVSQLRNRQEHELQRLEINYENSIAKWEGAISILNSSLAAIRDMLVQYEFSNQEEEIEFFKIVLPEFLSDLIFYFNLIRIERRKPVGGTSVMKKYYKRELAAINRYYKHHQAFYEYYRTGATYMDEKYYLRSGEMGSLRTEPFSLMLDTRICTSASFIVSTIIAHSNLREYLVEQLDLVDDRGRTSNPSDFGIKWTDTRAAIEEMVYAWYFKGSFNNGQVELKKLYEFVASTFGIQPANIYKSKQEFYGRSNISAYLELLLKRYKEGMEDTDDRSSRR